MPFRVLFAALLSLALAASARAQFTGDFSLTPADGTSFSASATVGQWSFTVGGSSGTAVLDLTDAPTSFTLTASATGLGASSTGTMHVVTTQAGTLSFDYIYLGNASGSTLPATAMVSLSGGTHSASGTGSGSISDSLAWTLAAHDSVDFTVSAVGGQNTTPGDGGGIGGLGGPGIITPSIDDIITPTLGSAQVTVTHVTFTPATVPEPGAYAAVFGAAALILAARRRTRK